MSKSNILIVDDAQQSTILAALRFYQQSGLSSAGPEILEIASNSGALEILSADQIDVLCESINQESTDKKTVMNALRDCDYEFSDFVSGFGESADSNPYVLAAQNLVSSKAGDVEVDDPAVVSEGDDDGAYVMAWVWVSNAEAGVVNSSDHLWDLHEHLADLHENIADQEDKRLIAYLNWLEETLDNFSDEIDNLEAEEILSNQRSYVRWHFDGCGYTFLPTEAIEALIDKAIETEVDDRTVNGVKALLGDLGEKMDRALSTILLPEEA